MDCDTTVRAIEALQYVGLAFAAAYALVGTMRALCLIGKRG